MIRKLLFVGLFASGFVVDSHAAEPGHGWGIVKTRGDGQFREVESVKKAEALTNNPAHESATGSPAQPEAGLREKHYMGLV